MLRELIAKRDLEIVQRDFVMMPIEGWHERSGRLSEVVARPPGKQRDKLRGEDEPDPLKTVTDPLPSRTHCSL